MHKNMVVSDILSRTESKNAPLLDVFLEILATLPSITSKNPAINKIILPIIDEFSIGSKERLSPNIIDEIIAIMKPIKVNLFGDKPVDENKIPIFSRIGYNFSLKLFNNNYFTRYS